MLFMLIEIFILILQIWKLSGLGKIFANFAFQKKKSLIPVDV